MLRIKYFPWKVLASILCAASIFIMMNGCAPEPEMIDDNSGISHIYSPEPVKQLVCKQHCEGTFSVISEFDAQTKKCVVKFQVPCMPYSCNKQTGFCVTECSKNNDCVSGAECDFVNKQCVWIGHKCKDDFTVISSSGSELECTPYKCLAGVCRDVCSTTSDCASGYDCAGGRCVLKK